MQVVAESDVAAVVWKRPGVSVESHGLTSQSRRAGEALMSCVTHLWGLDADVYTDLETWAGGLVIASPRPLSLSPSGMLDQQCFSMSFYISGPAVSPLSPSLLLM